MLEKYIEEYDRDNFAHLAKMIREHDERILFHTSKVSEEIIIEEMWGVSTNDTAFDEVEDLLTEAAAKMIEASELRYKARRIMETLAQEGAVDESHILKERRDYYEDGEDAEIYGTGW